MKRSTSGRRKKRVRKRAQPPTRTYLVTTPKGRTVRFIDGVPESIKRTPVRQKKS
ncbi:MAG: hypothetical protein V1778_04110 [bacterium]